MFLAIIKFSYFLNEVKEDCCTDIAVCIIAFIRVYYFSNIVYIRAK